MKFSVIVPLYNKALYVAKAIESVLSQSFTDYELIIIDDGSKDNSFSVALKAIEGRGNCHIYRQQNAGVSVARNMGVAFSNGDYLCFLDADDWWDSHFLEEMSKLIEEFPNAGIYGTGYIIVNEAKRKTRVSPIGVEPDFEKGYINYCQVYTKTLAMPLWTGSVCIPKSVFEEMKGFRQGIKLGEDFVLWIHVALKYKVAFLNKPLSYYNQDVDAANRGVGKLYQPQEHMLWNLRDLEPLEKKNSDYKLLIDNLRLDGLFPYFLSRKYHRFAELELEKVEWDRFCKKKRKHYLKPLAWLRIQYSLRRLGSKWKHCLLRITK